MQIGLVYDLRNDYLAAGYSAEQTAEFDSEETISALTDTLCSLNYEVDRIGNIQHLVKRLAKGDRWDLVFNVAEGLHGTGREAQVPALLEAYQIPYTFSDSVALAITMDKAITKALLRDAGIPTAAFAVIHQIEDINNINLPYPLFAKPNAEGTGKGIAATSRVQTQDELKKTCIYLLEKFHQPVLVETFLPGREFTVGILGQGKHARAIGVIEVVLGAAAEQWCYSYENKEHYETRVEYKTVNDASAQTAIEIALKAHQLLGCRDSSRVDLRADANGIPHFLEINPLAGLHPIRSDLPILAAKAGLSYRELIRSIVQEACQRYPTLACSTV